SGLIQSGERRVSRKPSATYVAAIMKPPRISVSAGISRNSVTATKVTTAPWITTGLEDRGDRPLMFKSAASRAAEVLVRALSRPVGQPAGGREQRATESRATDCHFARRS